MIQDSQPSVTVMMDSLERIASWRALETKPIMCARTMESAVQSVIMTPSVLAKQAGLERHVTLSALPTRLVTLAPTMVNV